MLSKIRFRHKGGGMMGSYCDIMFYGHSKLKKIKPLKSSLLLKDVAQHLKGFHVTFSSFLFNYLLRFIQNQIEIQSISVDYLVVFCFHSIHKVS